MSGPVPFYISVRKGGTFFGIRAEIPNTLQLPIEEKPLDLPLDSRLIIYGQLSLGPGDRDANWNIFQMGQDSYGAYFKLQCRGGPAMQRNNKDGSRSLIVPKLVNQLPVVGGRIEFWRLHQRGPNEYLIQSTATGLIWSVPRDGRNIGAIQLQPYDESRFIQSFIFQKVQFGGINDNRAS